MENSSFRVHLTRGGGHLPLRVDQARKPRSTINILDVALIGEDNVRLQRHALSSPLSLSCGSKGSLNTWRTLYPDRCLFYILEDWQGSTENGQWLEPFNPFPRWRISTYPRNFRHSSSTPCKCWSRRFCNSSVGSREGSQKCFPPC